MITTSDGKMVKVEMVNEAIRKGEPFRFVPIEEALRLESAGECRILRKRKSAQRYDDKMMVSERPDALGLDDVYGPDGRRYLNKRL